MSNAALLTRPTTDRAFERMYRKHVHDVYRYVLAVLRNPSDAEDATQATFLSAYRAFQRGDRPELPRNWLLKIAHNECRQRFRMLARRPKEVVWDERVSAPPVDESIPTADEIKQALGALSFNQRSALVMRELEGRSYSEIGEILDLSVSAIETLIFRARRALREQLEGGLSCGEAESTLSKRLDGTLAPAEQRLLRAHLRECPECAVLERKQRAQRAALKRLSIVQLPPSLASFFGGGAGTVGVVAGSGIAAKAAAVVAAGVIAGGVGHQAVEAVAASEPDTRTPLPALRQLPASFPALYGSSSTIWTGRGIAEAKDAAAGSGSVKADSLRGALRRALRRASVGEPGSGAPASGAGGGSAHPTDQLAGATPQPPVSTPAPVRGAVETAKEVVKVVPVPEVPTVPTPPVSTQPPVAPPPLPPLPPLPPPPPLLPGIGG